MRSLKRVVLASMLGAVTLAASASTASAVTISPASTAVTFTAGAVEFNAVIDIDCTGMSLVFTTPASGGSIGTVGLTFHGCTGDHATVPCTGSTASAGANGTYNGTASDADGRIFLPANSCTFAAAGCTLRIPRVATYISFDMFNNGAGAFTIVIPAVSLTYDASGPFWCFDSSATLQANGGGAITFTQSGGTALTVS